MDELPANIECEQQILGALMYTGPSSLFEIANLSEEAFFDPVHGEIFQAIKELFEGGAVADVVTLKLRFEGHEGLGKLGGQDYLLKLQLGAVATVRLKDYVTLLQRLHVRRRGIVACQDGIERLTRDDGSKEGDIIGEVQAGLYETVSLANARPLVKSFVSSITDAIQSIDNAQTLGHAAGISTGLKCLDKKIGSMVDGELLMIAGRPSMGKTALALNIAVKAAMRGEGVFFGSMEMFDEHLAMRAVAQVLRTRGESVPYFDMKNGRLEDEAFASVIGAARDIHDLPIHMSDPSSKTLGKLRAGIDRAATSLKGNLRLIVIDYLQLVDPQGLYRRGDEVGRVSAASEAMKAMATYYRVPVICLSQLSRAVETREPPIPMLSDLRGSGSVEQDADTVLFCYRPEYYLARKLEGAKSAGKGPGELNDIELELSNARNNMKIIVAKQRAGAVGSVSAHCDLATNYICDPADVVVPREQALEGFK